MKPTFKDYLSIALALLAIFLSGFGIGFIMGERKGQRSVESHSSPPPARSFSIAQWEADTLALLERHIEFTPEQLENVKREIAASAAEMRAIKDGAVRDSDREMNNLNKRLQPVLTPGQWEKLQNPPPIGGGDE